jgi:hypothetical protein
MYIERGREGGREEERENCVSLYIEMLRGKENVMENI